jgi:hypothetical protein
MIFVTLFLVSFVFTADVFKKFCRDELFCVHIGRATPANTYVFTVHAATEGWAAVGVGARMSAAQMYIGWENASGNYTVASSTTTANNPPRPVANQDQTVIPLAVPAPTWARTAFSFTRPTTVGSSTIAADSRFIFATGSDTPVGDTVQATYQGHTLFGPISGIDFTTFDTTQKATETQSNGASNLSLGFMSLAVAFFV